ncbi:MAG: hypothetical protein OIF32_05845 [Campylobacterales bacterium]|nr:hypothetical protein [Campylobacterales bacterium]
MLFQKTTEFLFERFPDKKFDNFDDQDTKKLYNFLFSFYSDENQDILFKKDEIREAIIDFFKEKGVVSVVFKGYEKIVIRIRPFDIHANTSRVLEKIKEYLENQKDEVIKNAPRSDLIELNEEIYKHLKNLIEMENPNLDKKSLIKTAVIDVFLLSDKDVVVFLKGKVFLRLFKELIGKPIQSEKGREGRFNGLPQEELQRIEKQVFAEGNWKDHITDIMNSIYSMGLDFTSITNETYEKNHISYLQKGLKRFLKNKLNYEDFIVDGFVNYILRDAFADIHQELAKKLLYCYVKQIGTAEIFINYFSGEVVVSAGGKHQLPKIEDEKGTWWQIPLIKVVVKQRLLDIQKRNEKKQVLQKAIKDKEEVSKRLVENQEELSKLKETLKNCNEELEEIYIVLKNIRSEYIELKRKYKDPKTITQDIETQLSAYQEDIKTKDKKESELLKTRDRLEKMIARKSHQTYEQDIKKEALAKKEIEDGQKLSGNGRSEKETREKYDLIVSALASALTKKKVKI